jgi:hypothetical protein
MDWTIKANPVTPIENLATRFRGVGALVISVAKLPRFRWEMVFVAIGQKANLSVSNL